MPQQIKVPPLARRRHRPWMIWNLTTTLIESAATRLAVDHPHAGMTDCRILVGMRTTAAGHEDIRSRQPISQLSQASPQAAKFNRPQTLKHFRNRSARLASGAINVGQSRGITLARTIFRFSGDDRSPWFTDITSVVANQWQLRLLPIRSLSSRRRLLCSAYNETARSRLISDYAAVSELAGLIHASAD